MVNRQKDKCDEEKLIKARRRRIKKSDSKLTVELQLIGQSVVQNKSIIGFGRQERRARLSAILRRTIKLLECHIAQP